MKIKKDIFIIVIVKIYIKYQKNLTIIILIILQFFLN